MDKLVSADEMARLLQIDKGKLYVMARDRQIPHLKIGGTYRFDPTAVIKHLTVVPHEKPMTRKKDVKKKKRGIDWSQYPDT